jgi:hypothetical protein
VAPYCAGINCGVMMFRNSDWSRAFLEQLWSYAHLGDEALQTMHAVSSSLAYSTGWWLVYSDVSAVNLRWMPIACS